MRLYALADGRNIVTYDSHRLAAELNRPDGSKITDLDEQHITLPSESTYDPLDYEWDYSYGENDGADEWDTDYLDPDVWGEDYVKFMEALD